MNCPTRFHQVFAVENKYIVDQINKYSTLVITGILKITHGCFSEWYKIKTCTPNVFSVDMCHIV